MVVKQTNVRLAARVSPAVLLEKALGVSKAGQVGVSRCPNYGAGYPLLATAQQTSGLTETKLDSFYRTCGIKRMKSPVCMSNQSM